MLHHGAGPSHTRGLPPGSAVPAARCSRTGRRRQAAPLHLRHRRTLLPPLGCTTSSTPAPSLLPTGAHGPYTVGRRPSRAKLGRAAAGAAVRATAAARAVLGRAEGRSCAWSRQRKTPAIGKPQPLSTPAARRLGQHVGGRHSGDQQAAARQLQTSQVVSSSGVGALGRAFWRTTLGYFVCYDPLAATADLVPAPQEVMQWPYWELGEMEGFLCVTFMDELVNQVVVIRLHLEHRAGEISWTTLAGHFEGGCLRNRDGVILLRSQGPAEVLVWDPMAELVVAMDLEGRTTRTIGPLSGLQYYADFIPYVSSSTGIFGDDEANAECTIAQDSAESDKK
ncbi:uncharacterized protein LOC133887233 [Phragmites australis]|uniref:uncharacterized protein LOC133887233 n=1 Tax=Phragmites australis TaxID=29695 RepID=UPI002D78E60B|nr:uncharacterized protein LOC133887233 [Phragmites australis]